MSFFITHSLTPMYDLDHDVGLGKGTSFVVKDIQPTRNLKLAELVFSRFY